MGGVEFDDGADPLAQAVDLFDAWQLQAAFELLHGLVATPARMATMPALAQATAQRLYAEVARELGRLDLALPIAGPLIQHCLATWGSQHPVTLRVAVCYATILHDLGRSERAEFLCRMVLSNAGQSRRHTARAILLAKTYLALIRAERGEMELAIEEVTATLSRFRQEFGRFDVQTIRITRHLATLHRDSGKPAVAHQLLGIAYAAAAGALGARHPVSRVLGDDLAEAARAAGPLAKSVHPTGRHRAKAVWRERPMRSLAYVAGVAAFVAVAMAITASLVGPSTVPPVAAAVQVTTPVPDPAPPGDVRLVADATMITVTWTDPSGGRATPVVTVAVNGRQNSMSLAPGTRTHRQRGYPGSVQFCVTITLLWPDAAAAQHADPVCAPTR